MVRLKETKLNKRQIDILDNIFFNDNYILFQKNVDSNIQLYQDLLLLERKKYITRNSFDCETYIFEMTKKGNDYIKNNKKEINVVEMNDKNKIRNIHIYLPYSEFVRFEKRCRNIHLSKTAVIRLLIIQYLEEYKNIDSQTPKEALIQLHDLYKSKYLSLKRDL